MPEKDAQFQVNIVGKEQGFESVEAAFRRMGLTSEQVEAQVKRLEEVAKDDQLAQHFRDVEVEMRRMGLTAEGVKKAMADLHDRFPGELEQHASRYDRVMNFFGRFGRRGGGEHEGGGEAEGGHKGGGEGGEHGGRAHGWEGISGHLDILRDHFGELRENIGETRESLAEMFPMLAGFGAVASAAGMVELIHATAEEQAQLVAMSKQLGVTANQLEAFHYAANISDVSVEGMDKAIARLGVSMADAASGHNKIDAAIFKKMGIALKDAHGQMVPIPKVLEEVSQALKNTSSPAMRLYVAQELLGKSGREMLPLLIQGREHFEDLTAEAERLGPALTDLDRDHLEQFNDAWKQAQYVSQSFMTKLGAELAPVMTPLLTDFTEYVAQNKEWIAQDAAGAVRRFADAAKQFPWEATLKGVETFTGDVKVVATDINTVVTRTVGWKGVLFALAAYKLASPFARVIEDTMRLGKLGYGLTQWAMARFPAALKVSEAEMVAFGEKGEAAVAKVAVAQAAAAKSFVESPLGKAVLALNAAGAGISIYQAADSFSNMPAQLNDKQKQLQKSLHLQTDVPLTPSVIKAIDALRDPGQQSVADPFAPPGESALHYIQRHLGLLDSQSGAAAALPSSTPLPSVPASPGPFGRFAPSALSNDAGAVHVKIEFENAPPGTKVTTTTTTGNATASVDVGQNTLLRVVAP